MSRRIVASLVLLTAIVGGALSAARAADEAKPTQQVHLVAILDYDEVFQNSLRYKNERDSLQVGTTKAENELKTLNEQIRKLEEELKVHQPGSPEFLKRQEAVLLKKHEMQARIQIERSKFEQKCVQLEAKVIKEIDDITKQISIENNIAMVTNVSTHAPPFNDLDATKRHRQRSVVYYNPGLDITQLVLKKLNDAYAEESNLPPEKRPANGVTRPGPTLNPTKSDKK